jgi:DNA-binding transcriptional LysR family regulator
MELRQLEYFVAVTEESSFTKAAARLNVAQPGVSAQLRQLERELGQPLLDRSARAVRLTEVGAAVLPHARAALAAVAAVHNTLDELTGLVRGHVAVGAVSGCGALGLPDLLASFHDAHPGVQISLREGNSDRLVDDVRAGKLDLALVAAAGAPAPALEAQVVIDESLVAAVRSDHPLRDRSTISLAELADQALVSLPRGTGLRASLDNACAAASLKPRIACEAGDPLALADLAARGLGVAILPESIVVLMPASLRALAITRPRLRGRIELVWRSEEPASPAARELIGRGREFFAEVAAARRPGTRAEPAGRRRGPQASGTPRG